MPVLAGYCGRANDSGHEFLTPELKCSHGNHAIVVHEISPLPLKLRPVPGAPGLDINDPDFASVSCWYRDPAKSSPQSMRGLLWTSEDGFVFQRAAVSNRNRTGFELPYLSIAAKLTMTEVWEDNLDAIRSGLAGLLMPQRVLKRRPWLVLEGEDPEAGYMRAAFVIESEPIERVEEWVERSRGYWERALERGIEDTKEALRDQEPYDTAWLIYLSRTYAMLFAATGRETARRASLKYLAAARSQDPVRFQQTVRNPLANYGDFGPLEHDPEFASALAGASSPEPG